MANRKAKKEPAGKYYEGDYVVSAVSDKKEAERAVSRVNYGQRDLILSTPKQVSVKAGIRKIHRMRIPRISPTMPRLR